MKVNAACSCGRNHFVGHYRPIVTCDRFEYEHICWDPKDGDLCLNRAKPGETLVEARSDTDVQIVRLIWV
jgi:hypothetical protein